MRFYTEKLGVIGNVGQTGCNFLGTIQVFQQAGTGVPRAVEVLPLSAGLDLQLNRIDGGGGDIDR